MPRRRVAPAALLRDDLNLDKIDDSLGLRAAAGVDRFRISCYLSYRSGADPKIGTERNPNLP
jgi:hypothetical protein